MEHICFKDVYKSFGRKPVLRGVNFSVGHGQCLTIIGSSGGGKSVSLRCLLGLVDTTRGEIWVDNTNLLTAPSSVQKQLRGQIGVLFQNAALFDSLTVLENVAFGLLRQGMDSKKANSLALETLKKVNLEPDVAILYPESLSGGMRKRVGIARAIVSQPKILLFDEPTSGLDPIMSDVINNLILKCVRNLNITAIVITHDMTTCRCVSDKVALLYQGQIIWAGSRTELDSTDNAYVQQFIHGSANGPIAVN